MERVHAESAAADAGRQGAAARGPLIDAQPASAPMHSAPVVHRVAAVPRHQGRLISRLAAARQASTHRDHVERVYRAVPFPRLLAPARLETANGP